MLAELGLTGLLSTFVISLLLCIVVFKWFRERNYPPGPAGPPLLGYGPFLGKRPYITLRDLSKKYGDVLSFNVGSNLHICISDYHLAKEILTHPLTLARPPHSFDILVGRGGMSGMNGEEWQEQRRFAFYTMRNLGMGKGHWESMIQISAEDFVEELRTSKGVPVNVESALSFSQASNSVALLFGRHLDKTKDAEKLQIIRRSSRLLMEFFSAVGITVTLPWLAAILETFHLAGFHRFKLVLRTFENIFREEVAERMKDPDSLTKDDFIGCYFKEWAQKDKESKKHTFNLESLLGNLFMLFLAGNDSTLAGVSWMLLLMAKHQDIQEKIHKEIDSTIGRDGVLQYDDKKKLPYAMATLYEMTRFVSINAIYPPRYAIETFTFNGYTIPQGAHIITNIWSILHDPRYFKDPMEFRPERFLSESGEKVQKVDGWAPFSFGKRNCPGEGVAIMSIFLYFVHIMQKFKVTMPYNKEPNLEPVFGGALFPQPQDMVFVER